MPLTTLTRLKLSNVQDIEVDDLADVDTSTTAPSNGQALVWSTATLNWRPGSVASGGGSGSLDLIRYQYNIASTTTTITGVDINGETLSYTDDNLNVYLNGVRLSYGQDYTATNGTSVVLAVAATGGSYVEIETWTPGSGGGALDDLSDVAITSPSNGQVLKYNGTAWVNGTDATGGGGGGGASAIDDLTDVTITSPSSGQVLKYNGTVWVNSTDSTGTTINAINDIGDVVITTASAGQVLKYDGTNWVNAADATGASATWTVVTANTTATAGALLLVDTTSASVTVNLPATPTAGQAVTFGDGGGDKISNPTVVGRNGSTIQGVSDNYNLNTLNHRVTFVYNGSTWRLLNG